MQHVPLSDTEREKHPKTETRVDGGIVDRGRQDHRNLVGAHDPATTNEGTAGDEMAKVVTAMEEGPKRAAAAAGQETEAATTLAEGKTAMTRIRTSRW